jgi:hypothetical protein
MGKEAKFREFPPPDATIKLADSNTRVGKIIDETTGKEATVKLSLSAMEVTFDNKDQDK